MQYKQQILVSKLDYYAVLGELKDDKNAMKCPYGTLKLCLTLKVCVRDIIHDFIFFPFQSQNV